MVIWIAVTKMLKQKINCIKCKKNIKSTDLHKIVIFIVDEKFTEHHYEHIECPEKFII